MKRSLIKNELSNAWNCGYVAGQKFLGAKNPEEAKREDLSAALTRIKAVLKLLPRRHQTKL